MRLKLSIPLYLPRNARLPSQIASNCYVFLPFRPLPQTVKFFIHTNKDYQPRKESYTIRRTLNLLSVKPGDPVKLTLHDDLQPTPAQATFLQLNGETMALVVKSPRIPRHHALITALQRKLPILTINQLFGG